MSISVRTAVVTVRAAGEDVTVPEDAVITADPALTPVARPVALMVAKFVALEFHVTLFVMSVALPSEKIPLAVNDCVWPVAIEAVPGVTKIEFKSTAFTVAVAEPVVDPIDAVMIELPADTPVTRPDEFTVAYAVLRAFQVARLVTSWELPSLYIPNAERCLLWPDAIENTAGVIVIEDSVGPFTTTVPVPETELSEAVTVTVPAFSVVRKPVPFTEATVGSEVLHIT